MERVSTSRRDLTMVVTHISSHDHITYFTKYIENETYGREIEYTHNP